MAKSILVITDVHDTENCSIKKAHDIAAPLGDEIDIVRFIQQNELGRAEFDEETTQLSDCVADIFKDYEQKDIIRTQVVSTQDIAKWVVDYCKDKNFDLVLKAGHRSETLFHTPCDWELIRQLDIPVLIASQQHWRQKHVVLAALDPNVKDEAHRELNDTILKWTKKWAETFNCQIHLVYSLPVSNILRELDIIDIKQYTREHRAEGEEKLLTLVKDYDLPNVQIHITAGAPEKTLPNCASKLKAELVIMGSTGRTGLKGKLLGNVAEKTMHNLRTDSLLIELKK
ncbi:universal stress protein [Algibacillus agarilyticus]|uniref:universal stress protein n=1 Tax=Algibacillus agarilyticus TaxID=2234133 RepID=UPI001300A337|nr:universal stress protein [Algibacillus agarilyticus]